MANKPLSMHRVRQILLHLKQNCSERAISRELKISRKTVHTYKTRFSQTDLDADSLLKLTDEELEVVVGINKKTSPDTLDPRKLHFMGQSEYFLKELDRVGVTRLLLWEEYRKEYPEGFGYSRFCDLLAEVSKVSQATMHFEHKPAEKLEVDFAGSRLHYLDMTTGEIVACPVLLAVLPFSGYGYVEALPNAQLPQVIKALNNCLDYFEGVPMTVKSDNMKQWVTKSCRYEPVFPEALEQWASHNSIGLLAARTYSPKDKPSVESHVNIIYRRIYAKIRNETFHSLSELNRGIQNQLEEHHRKNFQKKTFSRIELFLQQEKPHLNPLPERPYMLKHYTKGKVQKNYHVVLGEDWHFYSVPYRLIGRYLKIVYCSDHVEIYDRLDRVAVHKRNYTSHKNTTVAEHMPPQHQAYSQQMGWDPDDYLNKASEIGPCTLEFFKKVMESKIVIHQAYQSCLGLMRLAKDYGRDRLELACKRALKGSKYNYGVIATILKNNMDRIDAISPEIDFKLPQHNNTRGPQAYKNKNN
jgi:transposase